MTRTINTNVLQVTNHELLWSAPRCKTLGLLEEIGPNQIYLADLKKRGRKKETILIDCGNSKLPYLIVSRESPTLENLISKYQNGRL